MHEISEQEREVHAALHRLMAEVLAELRTARPGNRWPCEGCQQLQPLAGFRLCGCSLFCHQCGEVRTAPAPAACAAHAAATMGQEGRCANPPAGTASGR